MSKLPTNVPMTKWEMVKVYWLMYLWAILIIGAFAVNAWCDCLGATQPFHDYRGEALAVFAAFGFSAALTREFKKRFVRKKLGIKDKKIGDYYFKVDDKGVMRAYDKETGEMLKG